jgi:hypothetical protein
MARNLRFIASITTTAAQLSPVLPWSRGARRKAFITKRNAMAVRQVKSA